MADNGYRWWYIDALSEDGSRGLTIIALLGSVFSPYYALARRRGPAVNPLEYSALNAVFYGPGGRKRWAMTERGAGDLRRERDCLAIGPSRLEWDGESLVVEIDEVTVPLPRRLRGRVRLWPEAPGGGCHALDRAGRHHWRPLAPRAAVEVNLAGAGLRWRGSAYLDSNEGTEPLEAAFTRWNWSRAHLADGGSVVLYETANRSGDDSRLALRFPAGGGAGVPLEAPAPARLPPTAVWRIRRQTRGEGAAARVLRTLEDTPFYARSLIESRLCGESVHAVHESLDLTRFERPLVQALLPFRMPRRAG